MTILRRCHMASQQRRGHSFPEIEIISLDALGSVKGLKVGILLKLATEAIPGSRVFAIMPRGDVCVAGISRRGAGCKRADHIRRQDTERGGGGDMRVCT